MPWKSGTVMDSRREFVRLVEQGDISVAELCRRFAISRETGYVWLRRYRAEGEAGLRDRSSRPLTSPTRCAPEIESHIVDLRGIRPSWGGRKLGQRLRDLGVTRVPAASTVTEVLRRHGLLDPAESEQRTPPQRFERSAPNELWQMDFKGHIAMDRGRCHPLTVLDDHSRYSIGVIACANETEQTVKAHLTDLFRRHGLPVAMLADNGSPWGGSGATGYTAMEVWLMRVGIRLYHGRARHPQTQGKEERFHRTLTVELLQANRFADLIACQAAFDAFRRIYNTERPHEALGLAVPQSRYRVSQVAFAEALAMPDYYAEDVVRRVHQDGATCFRGWRVKLSQAFAGLDVAFRPTATDGVWRAYFMRFLIAEVDLRDQAGKTAAVRKVSDRSAGLVTV
ncbi:IS481 family transposase [Acidisphaera sp. S103]|uniref:IS481 family transposase n=1 Tax=Acidisphaera sp. S103 TaxID=1747223 RepID=UPI0020B15068|nr:IS481 family transposase [Acidisphaera sp. S103]